MTEQFSGPHDPFDEHDYDDIAQSPLMRLARKHWAANAELRDIYGVRTSQAVALHTIAGRS